MPKKTKMTDKKNPTEVNERDCFETPRYATEMLLPHIPKSVNRIWECAVGGGRIARVLLDNGYAVEGTDLRTGVNFLEQKSLPATDAEITNPPFSLKEEFFRKCLEFGKPFALLIPMEFNGWMAEAFDDYGCQALIPRRRINYITPNTLRRIHEGEVWSKLYKDYPDNKRFKNLAAFKKEYPNAWKDMLAEHPNFCNYESVDDAPQHLLHKYSSSDFHSGWLTWGFNLPKQLTFVDLSLEEIKNNI